MTYGEVIAIGYRLECVLVKTKEGWTWKEGYNDERIALECGIQGISVAHVKRLRRARYGEIPKPSQRSVLAAAVGHVKALEKQVTKLMEALEVPDSRSRFH